jgi:hypothetical protein
MGIHLAGEPVWFSLVQSTSTGASTVGLTVYTPGYNAVRPLLSTEQLALMSLSIMASAGPIIITSLAGGTASTSLSASTTLLEVGTTGTVEWHDDGTAALSGVPGVVPSVICNTGAVNVMGTGLITNHGMGTTRPSFLANLTQNPNGQF